MDKKIYAALDSIHAGPELKRRVKMNLSQTLSQKRISFLIKSLR